MKFQQILWAKFSHFHRNLRSLEFCIRVINLPMQNLCWVQLITQICRFDCQKDPWFKSVFMHRYIIGYRTILPSNFHWQNPVISNRVWLQTCSLRHLLLPQVTSLAVFFILLYLLIIFKLNLSTFYTSCQVVKIRKKNKKLQCHLQSPLALFATCDVNCNPHKCARCQWRRDAVVVKRLKLI